jgi:oligopeptide/dipeptide ABC transporter ATP-binding protein
LAKDNVVTVEDLHTHFRTSEGLVRAVRGASFAVERGKVLGVVGESGCGKSVAAQSVLRIVPKPGKIVGGKIIFHRQVRDNGSSALTDAIDLTALDPHGRQMRGIRGSEIAMVFQEPMTSLNPVYTIGNHLLEAITLHQDVSKHEGRERALDILDRVGMPQPERVADSYPHQLSGGMRQRAMIAIGLSCRPSLLIADEPTTALDVTTEAQILDLMRNLQQEMGMAIMYITHDLGVIAEMCDDVIVMYLGKVVEEADVDSTFYNPQHPYTQALLKSIPMITSATKERLESIKGIVPDPYVMIKGCSFWPRCPQFMPGTCDVDEPQEIALAVDHRVRCHLYA